MIALLSGILRALDGNTVILDVQGVGYELAVTGSVLRGIGSIGSTQTLPVVTQVREDAITLFGFASTEEKQAFLRLTRVQGVGAKMAISLLSVLTPEQLWRCILSEDKKSLSAAEGVGPKLAARLVTELKEYAGGQVAPSSNKASNNIASMMQATAMRPTPVNEDDMVQAAVSALVNLGYSTPEAWRAVSLRSNENPDMDLASLIRLSLQELSAA